MPGRQKHNEIVTTAKKLFYKYGSKRVTVEEICKTAGVSKVTYYKYFSNKADLIRTIGEELVGTGFKQFDEISGLDIPYPDKINRMTEWKMQFFAQMKNEFIAEIISFETIMQKARAGFLQNISQAQKKGEIRNDLSPDFIWLVTEKMNEIVRDGSWKSVFEDYRSFQKQMRILTFYGLLTRSGEGNDESQIHEEAD